PGGFADPGEYLWQAAAVGAGHRRQREADDGLDPGQAGHLLRNSSEHPAEGPGDLPVVPGQAVDDAAGDRVRRAVRRGHRWRLGAADRGHTDLAEARVPATPRGRA